jgi:protein-S-isoprenylcysteine O-methyltransferase Ste14
LERRSPLSGKPLSAHEGRKRELDWRREDLFILAMLRPVGLTLLRSLGTNLTDTVVTRRVHTLVTHGAYRWVRNPFYHSMALLILANVLIAANWFLLLSGVVVLFLIVVRTRTEEEKLLARFGDAYRAYMMQTRRFVPRSRVNRP